MSNYYNYICKTSKLNLFWDTHMHVASVPFCIPHVYKLKLDKYNYTKKFEKWNKLPYKAHMLYWKFHPKEYPF